jgi:AAA15 family ATPase/GTPase
VSVNEVTTMDNQQWINDFVYVTKRDQILIVLTLKCVEVGANVDNINVIFLKHMVRYQKLSNEELDSRWMCLGYDKDFVLKGYCIKVTSKLKSKFLPL